MNLLPSTRDFVLGALCCLLLFTSAARGQAPAWPELSVAQPGAGPADGAEPWGVVINPASLGEARGFLFGLRHSEISSPTELRHLALSRGTGLYVARPLPYLSRFVLAGGLELLRPGIAYLPPLTGKLTVALAYRVSSRLSLGLGYYHLFSREGAPTFDGVDSMSLSARLALGRFFAAGLVLHDLPAPIPRDGQGARVERSYELELLGRPIGDQRLELSAGLRAFESSRALWQRLRLWVRPTPGLGLGVESSLGFQPDLQPVGHRLDFRVGVGLSLDFANFGGSFFALFGGGQPAAASPVDFHGGSVALRFSTERYPALWRGPGRVYKIELAHVSGEAMLRLLADLRALERDKRARGIVIIVNGYGGGWGLADELRQALGRLRAAGRRVVAYGADLSDKELYIAAAAERIYLDPIGSVRLGGVSHSGYFVKDALDRLGVRADLVRVGEYKSTPESFTRSEPTEPARAQRQALIDELFERLCAAVETGRRLPRERVAQLVERSLFPARLAVEAGLVDGVATGEQVEEHMSTLLGESVPLAVLDKRPEHPISYAPPGVAVLFVEGDLAEGRSRKIPLVDLRFAGGQTLLDALYELHADPQVRAIVLRIDSPGGSALVSDLLARQVTAIARTKPVICSFGDVAASGGYYVAAPCQMIYVNPSTTTGSIGIFGGKVDLSGLLGWLGVRRISTQRGSHADLESPFRPYSDFERALIYERLRQGYDRFLDIVMQGRHLSREEAEARAQGRVFSGSQAVARKLADRTGGLMDAVAEARRRAGLSTDGEDASPIFYYPRVQGSLLGRLLGLPDLLEASGPSDLGRLLQATAELLPGLKTAILLLETEVLMRLDGEAPR